MTEICQVFLLRWTRVSWVTKPYNKKGQRTKAYYISDGKKNLYAIYHYDPKNNLNRVRYTDQNYAGKYRAIYKNSYDKHGNLVKRVITYSNSASRIVKKYTYKKVKLKKTYAGIAERQKDSTINLTNDSVPFIWWA